MYRTLCVIFKQPKFKTKMDNQIELFKNQLENTLSISNEQFYYSTILVSCKQ